MSAWLLVTGFCFGVIMSLLLLVVEAGLVPALGDHEGAPLPLNVEAIV
jgi:hypothetical protein